MLDDTEELTTNGQVQEPPRSRFRLSQKVDKILQTQNLETRSQATRWAESLRFLTFDNDDGGNHLTQSPAKVKDSKSSFTPDGVKGQCSPCQNRVSIPSGHVCADHIWNKQGKIQDRDSEWRKYEDPCVHVFEHACQSCQHIPLFRTKGRSLVSIFAESTRKTRRNPATVMILSQSLTVGQVKIARAKRVDTKSWRKTARAETCVPPTLPSTEWWTLLERMGLG